MRTFRAIADMTGRELIDHMGDWHNDEFARNADRKDINLVELQAKHTQDHADVLASSIFDHDHKDPFR